MTDTTTSPSEETPTQPGHGRGCDGMTLQERQTRAAAEREADLRDVVAGLAPPTGPGIPLDALFPQGDGAPGSHECGTEGTPPWDRPSLMETVIPELMKILEGALAARAPRPERFVVFAGKSVHRADEIVAARIVPTLKGFSLLFLLRDDNTDTVLADQKEETLQPFLRRITDFLTAADPTAPAVLTL